MLLLCMGLGAQQKYLLENEKMRAEVDLAQGALLGLQSKVTGWNVVEDEKAACSFEANVKLANGNFFVINAASQCRPEVTIQGDKLTFVWNGLNVGDQQLDATFTGTITMTPD